MNAVREHWSGRAGFILANVAAAVGLGSIWKFPYEVGANGGGTFVICYIVGLVLIVLPLMLCELAIGRRGRSDAISSVISVANATGVSKSWSIFAVLGIVTSVLILSFYSVIGGWAIAYIVDLVLIGLPLQDAASAKERYAALLGAPGKVLFYNLVFMTISVTIVARGITKGIERASMILMPILIVLLSILASYSLARGGFTQTASYLFAFDVSRLTPKIALEALGLGFFSIGVGLSIMIAYAAYAERSIDLRQVAIVTLVADTGISFLAAFAVFPVVFAEGLDPSSGPGLVFVTLPLAFSHVPFGVAAAIGFFVLVTVAAIGSAISFLEIATTPLQHALNCSRATASIACGVVCWSLGIVTILSFSLWADWFPLASIPAFSRFTWYDLIDHLTSNVLLPIAGFGIAIFVGWAVPRSMMAEELRLRQVALAALYALLRFVVPAGIAAASIAVFFQT